MNLMTRRTIGKHETLLCLVVTVVYLLFFSPMTLPIHPYHYDGVAIYACVGKGMTHGLLPYRDLFDHKEPLLIAATVACWKTRAAASSCCGSRSDASPPPERAQSCTRAATERVCGRMYLCSSTQARHAPNSAMQAAASLYASVSSRTVGSAAAMSARRRQRWS